jgi:hypothetical protein
MGEPRGQPMEDGSVNPRHTFCPRFTRPAQFSSTGARISFSKVVWEVSHSAMGGSVLRWPLISGQRNHASSRTPDFSLDRGPSKILESCWHERCRGVGRTAPPHLLYSYIYRSRGGPPFWPHPHSKHGLRQLASPRLRLASPPHGFLLAGASWDLGSRLRPGFAWLRVALLR